MKAILAIVLGLLVLRASSSRLRTTQCRSSGGNPIPPAEDGECYKEDVDSGRKVPDPDDCRQYLYCDNTGDKCVWKEMNCDPGKFFDKDKGECVDGNCS